ncbi:hypothetical protein MVES1_000346 [Malassezia vespertilionis]|uniref:DUF221-domain-containing protein n=1 Tax=Malassezia vespertilionis TaxID=2020962 RepID=A0A2N1JG64_9BASI|nr:uncharacterized protein MVES1_000346 [Malassezia vespertilionis]PKI85516.1 hypothetical protein MVES_000326 [Malassezia vespertilionis]WFD05021.1 hypothetical protein MVES1_000346 [Malassezia vespertilionis]
MAMAAEPMCKPSGGGGSSSENRDTSTSTVISSMILAIIMAAIFFPLFLMFRPRFRNIYRPRTYLSKPPSRNVTPLSDGLVSWIPQYFRIPDSEILRANGLDAYMFLSYLNMMLWIFVPIAIFTWIVLLPLYAARNFGDPNNPDKPGSDPSMGFNMFTFGKIIATDPQNQKRAAGALIVHYICTAWILLNLHWRMKHFIQLRQEFLISRSHRNLPMARTLLVTGVPNEYLSETKLTQIYNQLPGGVQKVWINRDLKELPKLVEERDKTSLKLEGAVAKVVKTAAKLQRKGKIDTPNMDPNSVPSLESALQFLPEKKRPHHRLGKIPCCGEKVDTITYCRSELQRMNQEITGLRQQAVNDYETFPPQSSAFLMFNTQLSAHLAANSIACHEPYRMANRYVEMNPEDVIWSNLNLNPYEQKIRSLLSWVATWATVIFWCIPVAIVSALAQYDKLVSIPFMTWVSCIPSVPTGIIKTVLPTAALAILNSLLPPWLRYLSRLGGIPTKNRVELSTMTRFFIFQVIQNFLFLTIVQGIVQNEQKFINSISDPSAFVTQISNAIPPASTFFLQMIMLYGLGAAPGMLLMIAPLIVYYIKIYLLGSTPRKVWHLKNDMGAPAWATLFGGFMLFVVIGLGYMILQPIVSGFAAFSTLLLYFAYRYLFLYVFDCKPQNETGGLFFVKAISFTFIGLYVSTVVVALMYFFNSGSNTAFVAFGVLTILLLVIQIAHHYFLMNSYGPLLYGVPLDLVLASQNADKAEFGSDPQHMQPQQTMLQQQLPEKDAYYMNSQGEMVCAPQAQGHVVQMEEPKQLGNKTENQEMHDAFLNPAQISKQVVQWYPNDNLGIGRAEAAADYKAGYKATVNHAYVTEKGKIDEDAEYLPGTGSA